MGLRTVAKILRTVAVTLAKSKLYIDLDGVITDFVGAVKKLPKSTTNPMDGLLKDPTQEQKQGMYDAIEKAGADFWSEMEWLPDGKKLWAFVKDKDPVLLSSPGEFRFAKAGKEIWVRENLPGITLFLESDKYQYAENDDTILIDDNFDNISTWKECGGAGIKHKDFETTKEELEELLN